MTMKQQPHIFFFLVTNTFARLQDASIEFDKKMTPNSEVMHSSTARTMKAVPTFLKTGHTHEEKVKKSNTPIFQQKHLSQNSGKLSHADEQLKVVIERQFTRVHEA